MTHLSLTQAVPDSQQDAVQPVTPSLRQLGAVLVAPPVLLLPPLAPASLLP